MQGAGVGVNCVADTGQLAAVSRLVTERPVSQSGLTFSRPPTATNTLSGTVAPAGSANGSTNAEAAVTPTTSDARNDKL